MRLMKNPTGSRTGSAMACSNQWRGVAAALMALAVVAAGCGTRVDEASAASGAAPSRSSVSAPAPHWVDSASVSGQSPGGPSAAAASAATAGAEGVVRRTTTSAAESGSAAVRSTAVPSGGVRGGSTGGQRSDQGAPKNAGAGGSGISAPTTAPPSRGSPVVVASVGTLSGPAGVVLLPMFQGAQLWAKWINDRGGLSGRPVRLVAYDDGGDPARHRVQVQQAIEQDKSIAFLANLEALTGRPSVEYVTAKHVPVIGMSGGEDWAYSSPMYFPQGSVGPPLYFTYPAALAEQVVPVQKTRVATVVCVEAQACIHVGDTFAKYGKALGLDVVYQSKASLAQPDFTAECLSAKNAGADVFFIELDQNSVGRVGAACARQGYRPIMAFPGQVAADRFKDDPNLEGGLSSSSVFPYFQDNTPATAEFHDAMRRFGGSVLPGSGVANGWVAGKILEKAAARLPDPPTSDAILAGLWSIHDDDLGGLTHPLTFVKDQSAQAKSCWFNLAISKKTWVTPDGFKLHCRDQ
jgi:branched-chain amino acid transport system substrate-binding protein